MSTMRAVLACLTAAIFLALAPAAAADPPDDATRAAARKIAEEGLALYDGAKYSDALDRFLRVEALVHAPTMMLMAARSLEKLGRLVESAEKYTAATQVLLGADASDAFHQAVKDAEKERSALLARVPSIVMTVDAPEGAEVTVTLDGAPIAAASLGQKKLIDPGPHTLAASAGGARSSSSVVVKEGESREVHLDLRTAPAAAPPLRTVGWVAVGVGAAGLVAGAVTGGFALAKRGEIDPRGDGCGKDGCFTTAPAGARDGYNTMRTLSAATLWAGGAVALGGTGILIFGPKAAPASTGLRWSPVVGAGTIGIKGAF